MRKYSGAKEVTDLCAQSYHRNQYPVVCNKIVLIVIVPLLHTVTLVLEDLEYCIYKCFCTMKNFILLLFKLIVKWRLSLHCQMESDCWNERYGVLHQWSQWLINSFRKLEELIKCHIDLMQLLNNVSILFARNSLVSIWFFLITPWLHTWNYLSSLSIICPVPVNIVRAWKTFSSLSLLPCHLWWWHCWCPFFIVISIIIILIIIIVVIDSKIAFGCIRELNIESNHNNIFNSWP